MRGVAPKEKTDGPTMPERMAVNEPVSLRSLLQQAHDTLDWFADEHGDTAQREAWDVMQRLNAKLTEWGWKRGGE